MECLFFPHTVAPIPMRAASVEVAGFEAHLLDVSPQPSVAITAAAYVGLRGRAIPAEFLRVQPVEVPMGWASQVKGGTYFWLHYDGLKEALQDKVHLKGYGKWARWQQRRGLFWSLALPRWSEWLTNVTVRSLAALPSVHRIRGRAISILTKMRRGYRSRILYLLFATWEDAPRGWQPSTPIPSNPWPYCKVQSGGFGLLVTGVWTRWTQQGDEQNERPRNTVPWVVCEIRQHRWRRSMAGQLWVSESMQLLTVCLKEGGLSLRTLFTSYTVVFITDPPWSAQWDYILSAAGCFPCRLVRTGHVARLAFYCRLSYIQPGIQT